ncbi:hypothetical protein RCDURKIN_57 [Rhodobacter phage RcDurkin]|nr:hypothetical protein RCDURKIN_57 [Rhodobacter phage RcDurkin]
MNALHPLTLAVIAKRGASGPVPVSLYASSSYAVLMRENYNSTQGVRSAGVLAVLSPTTDSATHGLRAFTAYAVLQ